MRRRGFNPYRPKNKAFRREDRLLALVDVVIFSMRSVAPPLIPKLCAASIFSVILPPSFGKRDFKIFYLAALKKHPPSGVPAPSPALTASQLADYEKYGYTCRDRLDIPVTR